MSQPSAGPQTPHQAPKKRHTVRTALLASGGSMLALVIAIGIWGPDPETGAKLPAVSTAPTKAASSAPTIAKPTVPPSTSAPAAPPKNLNKVTIARVGDEFTVGSGGIMAGRYTVLKGWTVTTEYGNPTFTGRIKNADDTKAPLPNLDLKFLNGSDLVMSFSCNSAELDPGQTTKLNCFSTDDYTTKWKTIVAETGL